MSSPPTSHISDGAALTSSSSNISLPPTAPQYFPPLGSSTHVVPASTPPSTSPLTSPQSASRLSIPTEDVVKGDETDREIITSEENLLERDEKEDQEQEDQGKEETRGRGGEEIELDEEEFENRATLIVQEYLSSRDLSDAVASLKEIGCERKGGMCIEKVVALAFEQKESDALLIFDLLIVLYEEQILQQNHFIEGIRTLLEILEDIEVDVPFAPKLLSEFLRLIFEQNIIDLEWIHQTIPQLTKRSHSDKILANFPPLP